MIKMADGAAAIEEASKLEWEGREVEPRHLTVDQMGAAEREESSKEVLYAILIASLHYKDDGTRVFKDRAALGLIPNIRQYRLVGLAVACAKFNKPPESELPKL